MAVLIFIACTLPLLCLGCNAGAGAKSKAKIVENYVLSANFENMKLAQIGERGKHRRTPAPERKISKGEPQPKNMDGFYTERDPFYRVEEDFAEGNGKTTELKERDLILPVPHPHPPPSTPVLSPHSVFAVGFMAFLMLLSNLQISLALGKQKLAGLGGLLGGLNKPAGRRKRRAFFQDPPFRRKPNLL